MAKLQVLARDGEYSRAIEHCLAVLEQRGVDRCFWKLQLALLYFLDETSQERWSQAPRFAAEAVFANPSSAEAHFWYGYLRSVLFGDDDLGRREFGLCLDLQPEHAYAHLCLAEMNPPLEDAKAHLEQVLSLQPTNFHALLQLAKACRSLGHDAEARRALETLLESEPYMEQGCGVMNAYVNEVLTQASSAPRKMAEARIRLATLQQGS